MLTFRQSALQELAKPKLKLHENLNTLTATDVITCPSPYISIVTIMHHKSAGKLCCQVLVYTTMVTADIGYIVVHYVTIIAAKPWAGSTYVHSLMTAFFQIKWSE